MVKSMKSSASFKDFGLAFFPAFFRPWPVFRHFFAKCRHGSKRSGPERPEYHLINYKMAGEGCKLRKE